jgi:hypothetical protein
MSQAYYAIVTGLPDLFLDDARRHTPFTEFADDLVQWLDKEDAALCRTVRYPYDNANLVLLLGDARDGRGFDQRGNFSKTELTDAIRTGGGEVPLYMHHFIAARRDGRDAVAGRNPEDQLTTMFFEEMTGHPNRFVREWYSFERDLRNVLIGLNCRFIASQGGSEVRTLLETAIIGHDPIARAMLKSTAPDFGLSASPWWAGEIIALDESDMLQREKRIDALRWRIAGDLTGFAGFGIETIMGFLVRLAIAQRWHDLDEPEGRQMFDTLAEELKAGFRLQPSATEALRITPISGRQG